MLESEIGGEDNLVRCITCFQSGLDAVRASNEHFVGVVVLWKQMIRCTSASACLADSRLDVRPPRRHLFQDAFVRFGFYEWLSVGFRFLLFFQ